MAGRLRYYYGPMSAGKSTLALQIAHNYTAAGRPGILLTRQDRSGRPTISSRLGVSADALEVTSDSDLLELARTLVPTGGFIVADEVQFYDPVHIEQLAEAVDTLDIDVDGFGIVADFSSRLFPGSQRMLELACEALPLQVCVLCWCGMPGRQNARLVDGVVVHDGEQVVVGDTSGQDRVQYRVLCRRHWRERNPGPA